MRRSTRFLAISLLLLALPAGANPRTAPRPPGTSQEDFEEARRRFEQAETAYKLGKFDVAIEHYEAAYKAMPEPAFLFNIAQAHRQQYTIDKKSTHLHAALNLYKTYLRESDSARNRRTVQSLIEELKQIIAAVEDRAQQTEVTTGRLQIAGAMAQGGTIALDGAPWGTVPHTGEVTAGSHVVEVRKMGFLPFTATVNVAAGATLDLQVLPTAEPVASAATAKTDRVDEQPVYKKWWFWTIVGVAAAGAGTGVGLGVYYGTRGDGVPVMPEIDLRN